MLFYIILAIILVLILLLLSSKAGIRFVFGSELKLWVKVGLITVQLYPSQEKKKESKKQKEEREADIDSSSKEKTAKRKITFEAVWCLISELIPPMLDVMERVRKGMHIRCLRLHLVISDPNPAVAAQRYGKMNAVIWPLLAAIENAVTVERRNVNLDLDFAAHKTSADGELFVTMRLYHGLRILLVDGWKILKPFLDFMKATEVEKKNRSAAKKEPADDGTAA